MLKPINMKNIMTASIILVAATAAMVSSPANGGTKYKCNAQTPFGKWTLTFKNGSVRGGGYGLQAKFLTDGSVRLSVFGENMIIGADGYVVGHTGGKSGKHNCNITQVHDSLQKPLSGNRLAIDHGDAKAQTNQGLMYEDGDGVLQDNVMAHMWYNIGAANGNELGGTNRDKIAKKMTSADISKAQQMARECMSSGYTNCGY